MCLNFYIIAVMCSVCGEWVTIVHLRPATRYFYFVAFKIVISGRRDFVCRHCKGDFCLGLVVHGYAFNRPARKPLARFGCVCCDCYAVAVVCGRLVCRAARAVPPVTVTV